MTNPKKKDQEDMKAMVELLQKGATMINKSCPQCQAPLFKLLTGEIYCARCRKQVVIVKPGEAEVDVKDRITTKETQEKTTAPSDIPIIRRPTESQQPYGKLRDVVTQRLDDFTDQMGKLDDPQSLTVILENISLLLEILNKIKQFK